MVAVKIVTPQTGVPALLCNQRHVRHVDWVVLDVQVGVAFTAKSRLHGGSNTVMFGVAARTSLRTEHLACLLKPWFVESINRVSVERALMTRQTICVADCDVAEVDGLITLSQCMTRIRLELLSQRTRRRAVALFTFHCFVTTVHTTRRAQTLGRRHQSQEQQQHPTTTQTQPEPPPTTRRGPRLRSGTTHRRLRNRRRYQAIEWWLPLNAHDRCPPLQDRKVPAAISYISSLRLRVKDKPEPCISLRRVRRVCERSPYVRGGFELRFITRVKHSHQGERRRASAAGAPQPIYNKKDFSELCVDESKQSRVRNSAATASNNTPMVRAASVWEKLTGMP